MQFLLNLILVVTGSIDATTQFLTAIQKKNNTSQDIFYECKSSYIEKLVNSFKTRYWIMYGILISFALITTIFFFAKKSGLVNIMIHNVAVYQSIGAFSILVVLLGKTVEKKRLYKIAKRKHIDNLNIKDSIVFNSVYYYGIIFIAFWVGTCWMKNIISYLLCGSIILCISIEILYCWNIFNCLKIQHYYFVDSINIRSNDMNYTNVKDYQIKNGQYKIVISTTDNHDQVIIVPKEMIVSIEKTISDCNILKLYSGHHNAK